MALRVQFLCWSKPFLLFPQSSKNLSLRPNLKTFVNIIKVKNIAIVLKEKEEKRQV